LLPGPDRLVMNAMTSPRFWNALTGLTLGATGLVAAVTVWLLWAPAPASPAATLPPALPSHSPMPAVLLQLPVGGPAALAYPTLPPAWTATLTPEPTSTRTPRPTATSTLTPSATPTLTSTPTLPVGARILNISGRRQALSLSCEARSAADWAAYFGIGIDEKEFLSRLPMSDDPEVGFVGDPNGDWGYIPPSPYGVYAGPVASLLQTYGAKAQAVRGLSWDDLRKEIISNRPVIVWIVGHVAEGTPMLYTAQDGHTTTVAYYEHTVIVTGYSETRVYVLDGENTYSRPQDVFMGSWSVLGNMAILWK
jgi:uncharacterized protein YvpB